MEYNVDVVEQDDGCLSCGKESYYGIVSVSKNKILHHHYCKPCYLSGRGTESNNAVQIKNEQEQFDSDSI